MRMERCRLGFPRGWMARIPCLCVFLLDITFAVGASGDVRGGNHSTVAGCEDGGSRPAARCAGSPLSQRLQSGLAVGGLCLILLLVGVVVFAYWVRKWNRPEKTDKNCNQRSTETEKKVKTSRPRPNKTVFTITNDRYDGVGVGELDKENLVFPDLSNKSRQHLEDTFNCYSKPVDGSESSLHDVT